LVSEGIETKDSEAEWNLWILLAANSQGNKVFAGRNESWAEPKVAWSGMSGTPSGLTGPCVATLYGDGLKPDVLFLSESCLSFDR
jgi:hypothetical protein